MKFHTIKTWAFALTIVLLFLKTSSAYRIRAPSVKPSNPVNQTISTQPKVLIVQLAIICDYDFSSLFQHNEQRMLDYWKAIVYDVHLRYQTLPSFNFSFQITSFRVLQEPMAFIEKARNDRNEVYIRNVVFNMEDWLGQQNSSNLPPFDIAVLATGAAHTENVFGIGRQSSICQANSLPGKWISNVGLSARVPDIALALAHSIGHVLEAPYDDNESYWKYNCGSYFDSISTYIMNLDDGSQPLFFSPCTDKALVAHFEQFTPHCLIPNETIYESIFDTARDIPSPVSVLEQCQVRTNVSDIYLVEHYMSNVCSEIACQPISHGSEKSANIRPINGSPCGSNHTGRCFRDFCLHTGIHFQNVATEKCMTRETLDSNSSGEPKLKPCVLKSVFQSEANFLYDIGSNATIIFQTSATTTENKNRRNCLAIGKDNILKFDYCHSYHFDAIEFCKWHLKKVETSEGNLFQLRNYKTGACIRATENLDDSLESSECCIRDSKTHFKLVLENGTVLTHKNYQQYIEKRQVVWDNYKTSNEVVWIGLQCFVLFLCMFCMSYRVRLVVYGFVLLVIFLLKEYPYEVAAMITFVVILVVGTTR